MRDAITDNGGTTSAVIVAARVEQPMQVAAVTDPNSTAPEELERVTQHWTVTQHTASKTAYC